jgi:hypothetical protein
MKSLWLKASLLLSATCATAGGTLTRGTATLARIALIAMMAAMVKAMQESLQPAEAAPVQVATVLARIRAADVVAVAIAGIGTRRVALPIAVIEFAAAAALIRFASELRRITATVAAACIAGRTTIITAAANQTVHHTVLVMPTVGTTIRDDEYSD